MGLLQVLPVQTKRIFKEVRGGGGLRWLMDLWQNALQAVDGDGTDSPDRGLGPSAIDDGGWV